jgi:tRNA threonylcarbamoyladenosine biosynthesis protein TsaB
MTASSGPYSLAIEASTYAGSVAVLRGADVVLARDVEMGRREDEQLMPAVAECVATLPDGMRSVERIVCGAGPGSFTSLRIAASIANGICHARGIPLFDVSSLALIVAASEAGARPGRYLVSLDAMRGESFAAIVEVGSGGMIPASVGFEIVPSSELRDRARGAGAEPLPGAPHATGVARVLQSVIDRGPVDLAAWEPDYGRAAEAQVRWEAAHGRPLPR